MFRTLRVAAVCAPRQAPLGAAQPWLQAFRVFPPKHTTRLGNRSDIGKYRPNDY